MLAVAEGVFATRGFRGATMEEIPDLVRVTKPLIYDYLGSKKGLLAATIERAPLQLLAVLVEVWETEPDAAVPTARLTGVAEVLVGGCERLAVSRAEQHRMSPDEAAELVMTTLWDGLGVVTGRR